MADIHFRVTTIDDSDIITHHRNSMFADMDVGTVDSRAQMDIHFKTWLHEEITQGHYLGWFACDGDSVVAGAGLWLMNSSPVPDGFAGRLPYLLDVYTEPSYRKQGLARKLVTQIIDYCREQGYPKIRLHASIYGRPLYEQLGFVDGNEMQLKL
ncbi:MAG: GNAT family N-acetyltransferase [Phototrophicaceae bacterium]